ncbi:hypothetical protein Aple_009650 [Acrocarpospora pleiomorpha]|uniref:Uncharacterized protein n=1 Tax=Acrocarpospora pleiomorpha TaxID=90975 RepID=A0A5M3XAA2_9ACTN|nr:hypothetical protein Aple_009650 [Acrocarpospora pleiomorpha]
MAAANSRPQRTRRPSANHNTSPGRQRTSSRNVCTGSVNADGALSITDVSDIRVMVAKSPTGLVKFRQPAIGVLSSRLSLMR